jgi:hypothetical protein
MGIRKTFKSYKIDSYFVPEDLQLFGFAKSKR